jgi:hypothetical protein
MFYKGEIMKTVFKLSIFMLFILGVFMSCNKENIKKQEVKKSIITISDRFADCVGAHGNRKCMLIKDDETNEERFLYSNIEGFKYEEGFKYKLEIEISKLKKPIIDGSSMKYKLIKVIYKNKVDTSSTLNNQKKEIKAQNIEPIQKEKEDKPQLMRKPILYLYPKSDIDVSVKLKHSENIVHSYPKYVKDGWKVNVKKDGIITYKDKKFYSLYWEMLDYGDFNFNEGFVVKKDDLIPFLEKSLKKLGLNYKESQEFIIYWLPILEKNELNLIKFETIEYNKKQPIEILPKPDTLIRVMMVYKKIDAVDILIKQQVLPENKRIGFTAVEWGGVEVK